jgi:hypothetical protein
MLSYRSRGFRPCKTVCTSPMLDHASLSRAGPAINCEDPCIFSLLQNTDHVMKPGSFFCPSLCVNVGERCHAAVSVRSQIVTYD